MHHKGLPLYIADNPKKIETSRSKKAARLAVLGLDYDVRIRVKADSGKCSFILKTKTHGISNAIWTVLQTRNGRNMSSKA